MRPRGQSIPAPKPLMPQQQAILRRAVTTFPSDQYAGGLNPGCRLGFRATASHIIKAVKPCAWPCRMAGGVRSIAMRLCFCLREIVSQRARSATKSEADSAINARISSWFVKSREFHGLILLLWACALCYAGGSDPGCRFTCLVGS